ncbi:MAG: ATP-binding protein, partial [Acidimicrobiia bacterium]
MERGQLYLGEMVDPTTGDRTGEPVLYASHHLTTHGVIVGMTGSGKTGLGMILLEEALLSGIPCLIIDPKGDMGNLLLNFPDFRGEDFRPWMDEGRARREGVSAEELAGQTAAAWKDGLASSKVGPDRMRRLLDAAEVTIYTPGSAAGTPLNAVGSLAVPDLEWDDEAETLRDEIEGFVSSLLVLAGIEADPISSPEHILLANIIEESWRGGRHLDLAGLIGRVQQPPFRKLGVFELDAFFPPKDRTRLAMRLNGLVASPSFASWLEGPPFDVEALLHGPEGKPRAAILYLAHLTDTERQFVVTLALSKLVTWMRKQSGSSDLRALVYMDEVFGFAPPTAQPPSKKPVLTLLKGARAFGVGLVLSTQNPVDLDYKAMSNAGTWMVGRLQTERDKARILEGMKLATGTVDVDLFDRLISNLGKRQFVLQATGQPTPSVFTTRWAISYMAGPLTRDQVASLSASTGAPDLGLSPRLPEGPGPEGREGSFSAAELLEDVLPGAPATPEGVPVAYLGPAAPWADQVEAIPGGTIMEAAVAARVQLLY